MSCPTSDPCKCVQVTIIDEEAVDGGGPMRDLFSVYVHVPMLWSSLQVHPCPKPHQENLEYISEVYCIHTYIQANSPYIFELVFLYLGTSDMSAGKPIH